MIDLTKIQTMLRDPASLSAPLEWLAVHRETGKSYPVVGLNVRDGRLEAIEILTGVLGKTRRSCPDDLFHLCAFTGYYDVDDKIYCGQLLRTRYRNKPAYGVVFSTGISWYIRPISDNWRGDRSLSTIYSKEIIGHIHIKPWPEEVKALLEEGEK